MKFEPPIQVYESDFALMGMVPVHRVNIGIMDDRILMMQLGISREMILEWRKHPTDRWALKRLIRQVVPGFMNKTMRREPLRAFHRRLEGIYKYTAHLDPAMGSGDAVVYRRISDFTRG